MREKKERQSNFELMRLISMFFIVVWHIIVHGKLFNEVQEPLILISNIIMGIIIVHVNSLVFLTGYYSCEQKEVRWKKAGRLLGTAWFYKILILLVFLMWNFCSIEKIKVLEELLPFDINNYWFINYYLVLSLLSPYLNRVIENMNEKDFAKFIGILFLLLSIIPAVTNMRTIMNDGYTLMNFVFMYFLGAYFRKNPIHKNYHFESLSKKQLKWLLFFSFFGLVFIRLGVYCLSDRLLSISNTGLKWVGGIIRNDYFRYSSPFVIIQTCIYCLWFECLNIKSKFVNFLAKSVLGVYLIHDNHIMRLKLYQWLKVAPDSTTFGTLKILIFSAIIIYVGSLVIETIRRFLVKLLEMIYTIGKQCKMKTAEGVKEI